MHQIYCSTGALIGRPNNRDYRLIAPCIDKLKCDAYEFMMYEVWYEKLDHLAPFLAGLDTLIPVMHCEKHIGELISKGTEETLALAKERFEINCQLAVYLHAKRMVMHLWDGLTSDQFFSRNLEAYAWLRPMAQRHGIDLMIENVVCNHEDPLTHWRALSEKYDQVHFIYDTKMAAFHSQIDEMYAPENRWLWQKEHIRHLHINDYGGGHMDWANLKTLHIGKGKIDFEKFFTFLKEVGYAGDYTVEATSFVPDGIIDCDALNRTFAYIREHIA